MTTRRKGVVEKFNDTIENTKPLVEELDKKERKEIVTLEQYTKEINTLQTNIVKNFLILGAKLVQANKSLAKEGYKKLLIATGITQRTSERLQKIFNDERLAALPTKMLPHAWTTAHYLTTLDDEQFAQIKDSIQPTTSLAFYKKTLAKDEVKEESQKQKSIAFAQFSIQKVVSEDIARLISQKIMDCAVEIRKQLDVPLDIEHNDKYADEVKKFEKEKERLMKFAKENDLSSFFTEENKPIAA